MASTEHLTPRPHLHDITVVQMVDELSGARRGTAMQDERIEVFRWVSSCLLLLVRRTRRCVFTPRHPRLSRGTLVARAGHKIRGIALIGRACLPLQPAERTSSAKSKQVRLSDVCTPAHRFIKAGSFFYLFPISACITCW